VSGRVLADHVKEHIPDARVLFMSGYADDALTRNGTLEAGAAFVEKVLLRGRARATGARNARRRALASDPTGTPTGRPRVRLELRIIVR
jgi:hypothetical protein